ncbi:MAG: hypothetical protein WCG55_04115 [bacterium]
MDFDKVFGPIIVEFTVAVAEGYNPTTAIDEFTKTANVPTTAYHFNKNICSKNWNTTENRPRLGKTYTARMRPLLQQVPFETCINLLQENEPALFFGTHGLALTFEKGAGLFPLGYVLFLDEVKNLWIDGEGKINYPYARHLSDGKFEFGLGKTEVELDVDDCILYFCEA